MFLLDMKTMFVTLVVGHIFSVILISAYWRHHKKDSTFNVFFFAKCIQALAWLLLTLRGGISDIFTIAVANTLLLLGASLETISLLKLQKVFYPLTKKIYIMLTVLIILLFYAIILINNQEPFRIAAASFGTALFISIPAYHFIREKYSTFLMKLMGYFYIFIFVSFIGRGVNALMSETKMGLFTPGITQSISLISLFLIMILGNTGFVLILKEQADDELIRLASYDDLTNVYNRRTFKVKADQVIHDFASKNKPISMLLFDVDHFKQINDTYGHDMGDRVLQDLTSRIRHEVGMKPIFGRYGGDEFAIMLPGLDEMESTRLVEKIKVAINNIEEVDFPVAYTLSIGLITIVPERNTQLAELYNSCDKALYEAKKLGRNCIARYEQSIFS